MPLISGNLGSIFYRCLINHSYVFGSERSKPFHIFTVTVLQSCRPADQIWGPEWWNFYAGSYLCCLSGPCTDECAMRANCCGKTFKVASIASQHISGSWGGSKALNIIYGVDKSWFSSYGYDAILKVSRRWSKLGKWLTLTSLAVILTPRLVLG